MEITLDVAALLFILALMTITSAIHGVVGYGVNILAAPLLMLIDPRFVPAPMLLSSLALTFIILMRDRQGLDLRGLTWIIAGRIPGAAFAAAVLVGISGDALSIAIGIIVLVAVWMSLTGLRLPPTPGVKFGAGFVSGLMATLSAIGGPPVALIYQDAAGKQLRANLSGYFVFGSSISMISLLLAGKFGLAEVQLGLLLLPGSLLGFLLSGLLVNRLDRKRTRLLVLGLSALAGGILILQTIMQ
jgi:hypothetical protein